MPAALIARPMTLYTGEVGEEHNSHPMTATNIAPIKCQNRSFVLSECLPTKTMLIAPASGGKAETNEMSRTLLPVRSTSLTMSGVQTEIVLRLVDAAKKVRPRAITGTLNAPCNVQMGLFILGSVRCSAYSVSRRVISARFSAASSQLTEAGFSGRMK